MTKVRSTGQRRFCNRTLSHGGISRGHVLRLQGWKMETLQPEGAPVTRITHPLTVRIPLEDPEARIVTNRTDLLWAVVQKDQESLTLAPITPELAQELAMPAPRTAHRRPSPRDPGA